MKVPPIKPEIEMQEMDAIHRVMQTSNLSTGPEVLEFEEKFAKYIGVDHAIAVNSGTSALELALESTVGHKRGSIILPSFTFMACPNSIMNNGQVPGFVDILPISHTIDYKKCEISSKTKAIMPVHIFGHPAHMDHIIEIGERHDLVIIEDCAEACGASIRNRKVGSFGDVGVFSFTASKNITTGEGGMITTNDEKIAEKIRLSRSHGNPPAPPLKPWIRKSRCSGHNFRMSNILAAIGVEQLKKLDTINKMRRHNANYMSTHLENIEGIRCPSTVHLDYEHVYQMYCIELTKHPKFRDTLVNLLISEGVGASIHFDPPCHKQGLYNSNSLSLPITESLSRSIVTLPMYPGLCKDDMDYMIECIENIMENGENGLHSSGNRS